MSAVTLQHVTRRFGTVTALDDVSVHIASGEMVALLGPSGCGKTTLLRSVAGLERPDAGAILIDGKDVVDVPTRRRPIGMVFQSYALFPNLSVRQNIAFPLEVRGTEKRLVADRVEEMLDLCRLTVQADRYPNQISGGQAQRCALGRALAPAPAVLLLDEPLSALDALVRVRLRDEIRRVQQQVRITALYVTHDQSEAMAIADRVAVMNHGRIEQLSSPAELYEDPMTEFTASFVGGRNAVELPVVEGRVALGRAFTLPAPDGDFARATAFFRPEDVVIGDRVEAGHPARIEMKVYLGPTTRLHLRAETRSGPVLLQADLPSRAAAHLVDGEVVQFQVAADHVKVFPAPGTARA